MSVPQPVVVLTYKRESTYRMELYVEPPRRRTLPIRGGKSFMTLDMPEIAFVVLWRDEAFFGVAPYRFVTAGGRPKRAPTRRIDKRSRLVFYNLGNSSPQGTCLGGAERYVRAGSLHPVQAYWNTTFHRPSVTYRDDVFRQVLATGYVCTLPDVFRGCFGFRPTEWVRNATPSAPRRARR